MSSFLPRNLSSESLLLLFPFHFPPCIPILIDKSLEFISMVNAFLLSFRSLKGVNPILLLFMWWSLWEASVKQLSIEQSAGWIVWFWIGHKPENSFIPENAELRHWVDTLETSSESWTLAASSPTVPKFCRPRVSWAFSNTACRYFPWASILSCKCRCTYFQFI